MLNDFIEIFSGLFESLIIALALGALILVWRKLKTGKFFNNDTDKAEYNPEEVRRSNVIFVWVIFVVAILLSTFCILSFLFVSEAMGFVYLFLSVLYVFFTIFYYIKLKKSHA